ncbi:putative malate dehydrogenase 1B [Scleropages formosus]|uniref:Malate dehydrogenase 1B, NAD (soluble) n=1 Tax=Scleropages formosus TaxID=113540 RepID=A0A8C9S1X9_SCLFO|nr:putative malate dehydrogenase 1B [Scleropages formosus]
MAKFVLAGRADCPHFAKAELLADTLHGNLPDFHVHKVRVHPRDWQQWLEVTCKENSWKHDRSPIVWRELINRGGRGLLLGGFNEFLEHVQGYYGLTSDMTTELMMKISAENLQTTEQCLEEEVHYGSLMQPLHIWITSALSLTCYNLIPLLFGPGVFRDDPAISLHLLEVDGSQEALDGLRMEVEDMALAQLRKVMVHTTLEQAFQNARVIVALDDPEPEQQSDVESKVRKTAERFQKYGQLIGAMAHKEVRVIVAGNSFVNLKCATLLESAPSLSHKQCVVMATQLEKVATFQIVQKLNVTAADVTNVIVWGNITGNFHIDLQRAKVFRYQGAIWGPPGFSRPVVDVLYDRKWLEVDFPALLGSHRETLVSKTRREPALSAANGIIAVLRAWNYGSSPGEVLSLGVPSTGQFGIPAGQVFSVPVLFQSGTWEVPTDIVIDEELRGKLEAAVEQLREEKETASRYIKSPK